LIIRNRRTNPGRLVARATEFSVVAPSIYSIFIAVPLHINMCISSHALSRNRQMVVRFVGHSRIVGSQYGTSCHPSGAKNMEMAPTFLENLCTAVYARKTHTHTHTHTVDCSLRDSLNLNSKSFLCLSFDLGRNTSVCNMAAEG
jgi:hypothetical protein